MKPVVVFQPLSKFGISTFVVFFLNWRRKQDFRIFGERTKRVKFSKEGGIDHL